MSDESLRRRARVRSSPDPEDLSGLLAASLRAGEIEAEREPLVCLLLAGPPPHGGVWPSGWVLLGPVPLARLLVASALPVIAHELERHPLPRGERALWAARAARERVEHPSARRVHQRIPRGALGEAIGEARLARRPRLAGAFRAVLHALEALEEEPRAPRWKRRWRRYLRALSGWLEDHEPAWRALARWSLADPPPASEEPPLRELLRRARAGERQHWGVLEAWGACARSDRYHWLASWLTGRRHVAWGHLDVPSSLGPFCAELVFRPSREGWKGPGYYPCRGAVYAHGLLDHPQFHEPPVWAASFLHRRLGERRRAEELSAWLASPPQLRPATPDGPADEPWAWGVEHLPPLARRAAAPEDSVRVCEDLTLELLAWAFGLDEPCGCEDRLAQELA